MNTKEIIDGFFQSCVNSAKEMLVDGLHHIPVVSFFLIEEEKGDYDIRCIPAFGGSPSVYVAGLKIIAMHLEHSGIKVIAHCHINESWVKVASNQEEFQKSLREGTISKDPDSQDALIVGLEANGIENKMYVQTFIRVGDKLMLTGEPQTIEEGVEGKFFEVLKK